MRSIKFIFCLGLIFLTFSSCINAKVKHYRLEVVKAYPHDDSSYTEGLFFLNNKLYESTGMRGESTFRQVDLESGKAIKRINFDDKYFIEGSTIFKDKLYILTWTSHVAFIYDPNTLQYIKTLSYPRQGWGLTTDGKYLIASDGTANLYFMDENLQTKKVITVCLEGKPTINLNELEYINGKIWANIYTTDNIEIINPKNGKVEAVIDCSNLLPANLRDERTDVLNGIAYNPLSKKIYLTGKYWKRLYEVKLKAE